jgi:hypothetical protein
MKPLLDYTLKEGSTPGRVRLSLRTADNTLRAYLEGEQVEQLALELLSARFDIHQIILDRPKRKRRGLLFLKFHSPPRPHGERPYLSEETLAREAQKDPTIRARLKALQDKWDRREARRRARLGITGEPRFSFKRMREFAARIKAREESTR